MNWKVEEQFLPEDMGVSNGVWIIDTKTGLPICEISPSVNDPIGVAKRIVKAVKCYHPLLHALAVAREGLASEGYITPIEDAAIQLTKEPV